MQLDAQPALPVADRDALLRTIEALEGQRAMLGNEVIDLVVAPLQKRLAELDSTGATTSVERPAERKIVTVMFVDVAGFTAMSERVGSETALDIVNGLFERLVPIVERYGGVVDKFIGDEIMAVFGAPRTLERHAEHALRAAVEMYDALRRFNRESGLSLGLHAGINTGEVVAGEVGSRHRRDYSVTGDTVNVAARLTGVARAGDVVVGASTYRHAFSLFDFELLEPLLVKGKSRPLQAYRLTGTASHRAGPAEGLRLPFLGRSGEVDVLLAMRGAASLGARVVFVRAEPGIGKTRLVSEVRDGLGHDVRWLQAGGQPYRSDVSYGVVHDLLDDLVGTSERKDDAVQAYHDYFLGLAGERLRNAVPYLLRLRGLPLDPADEAAVDDIGPDALRERFVDAVGALMETAAGGRSLVICVEDLHWADASSVALLRALSRSAMLRDVLFVVTTRPERSPGLAWVDDADADRGERVLDLAPLTDQDSRLLLAQVVIDDGEATVVDAIRAKAQGNPLYLASFLRSLVDSGAGTLSGGRVALRAGVSGLVIPDTVQAVVGARIDRLAPADKRVLQWASVLGIRFAARDVAGVAAAEGDRHDTGARLEALCERQLLARDAGNRYAFVHAVVRDVAYDQLLARDRRHLHQLAAGLIERTMADAGQPTEADVALLASHYELAEDRVNASLRYDQAAGIAHASHAHLEEAGYLDSAIRLAEPGHTARLLALRERAGDALQLLGRYAEAATQFETAFACVGDDAALVMARLYRKIARTWTARMAAEQANRSVDEARRCLREAGVVDTPAWWREHFELELFAMWAVYMQGRTDDGWAIVESLRPDIDRRATTRERGLFHRNVALLRLRQQRYRSDAATVELAQLAAREVGEAGEPADMCLTNFGVPFTQLWSGDLESAQRGLRMNLDETVRLGDAERNLLCLVYLGVVSRQLGDVDSAEAFSTAAVARARANRSPHYESVSQGTLAWVAWRRGNCELADRLIELGRNTIIPHYPFAWIYAAVALARAVEKGDGDAARAMLELMTSPSHQRLDDDVRAALEQAIADPGPRTLAVALDACRRARYL
jgi:class 3 adenylate cyclase/tetratricopeptide (TPR) repeat protein